MMPSHPFLGATLDETVAFHRRFVVFNETQADAVALWNAHTYVYRYARATPYLHPHSPEPGSGKTTLLDVVAVTARNPIQADNLTEAVLFRIVHKYRDGGLTLLFDEVDAVFSKKNSDSTQGIRQVLNSGYRQDHPAYRCVPPSHDVAPFDVYCAKATAGLNELPQTLAHRSIPIAMKPPRPDDVYEDFDPEDVADEAETLRTNLQSWADMAQDVLRDPGRKPEKLPGLDARGNEIWRILLRIADHAAGDWPERARVAAVELSGGSREKDASAAVKLLSHIRDLFDGERMSCKTLVDALNEDEELPYGGWSDGKGISTRELGKKLGPYGIHAKPVRIEGERAGNGYDRGQFADAWIRYLPQPDPSNRYTGTSRIVEPNSEENKPVQTSFVPVLKNGSNPHGQRDVPVVPVSELGVAPRLGDPGYALHMDALFATGRISEHELQDQIALDARAHRAKRYGGGVS